ncbi:MAG: polyhydroxyalkanoic acid system family protein [Burkholderiaceae bacterium]
MADLQFERAHGLGLAGAREAAQRVADEMAAKYEVSSQWEGDVLHFRRSGVQGTLAVSDDLIRLQARLGALLGAFVPRIQARLSENFDQYFG